VRALGTCNLFIGLLLSVGCQPVSVKPDDWVRHWVSNGDEPFISEDNEGVQWFRQVACTGLAFAELTLRSAPWTEILIPPGSTVARVVGSDDVIDIKNLIGSEDTAPAGGLYLVRGVYCSYDGKFELFFDTKSRLLVRQNGTAGVSALRRTAFLVVLPRPAKEVFVEAIVAM